MNDNGSSLRPSRAEKLGNVRRVRSAPCRLHLKIVLVAHCVDIVASIRRYGHIPAMGADDAGRNVVRRVPRVKSLRRALGLAREEFAARYHIPLGTLRRLGSRTHGAGPAGAGLSQSHCQQSRAGLSRACQGTSTAASSAQRHCYEDHMLRAITLRSRLRFLPPPSSCFAHPVSASRRL